MARQAESQFGCQGYRSTADTEGAAPSSKVAAISKTLDPVVDELSWSVSEYCTHYGRMMGARRFAGMFIDGQSKTMVDRHDMLDDTDFGAWKRLWSSMRH